MKRVRNLSTELSSFVQAQAGEKIVGAGDVYFLVKTASATSQFRKWLEANGVTESHYSDSLTDMQNAMTAYRNDTLIVLPGAHTLTTGFTWSKQYCNIIGTHVGAMNQRSRISTTTAQAGTLFTLTGEGTHIKNIMFSQEGSHATGNAIAFYANCHRPVIENCSFRNIGASAVVDNSHRSLKIGTCYDITFRNCSIGETSYDAATATSYVIEFSGTDGGKYLFYDCMILGAGSANASFLYMPANIGGFTMFKDCLFHNSTISSLDPMTQAFNISGTGNDGVFLKHCMVSGATNLETSDSGVLYGINAQAAATGELAVALTG